MDMQMGYCLTCYLADIDPDIKAIRMMIFFDYLFCYNDPLKETRLFLGSCCPFGPVTCDVPDLDDIDGDQFYPPEDCNDQDPASYPGAVEIYNDGIDQNCVNGDATITIFKARYLPKKQGMLIIEAITEGGQTDPLSVDDYGNMKWTKKRKGCWSLNISPAINPGSITIRGLEGYVSVVVQ